MSPEGYTYCLVGIQELRPWVPGQHVDDDDLPPLLNVDQEVAQLAEVFMDEVNPVWTDLLKGVDDTTGNKLIHKEETD